jgi:hypothetical protein
LQQRWPRCCWLMAAANAVAPGDCPPTHPPPPHPATNNPPAPPGPPPPKPQQELCPQLPTVFRGSRISPRKSSGLSQSRSYTCTHKTVQPACMAPRCSHGKPNRRPRTLCSIPEHRGGAAAPAPSQNTVQQPAPPRATTSSRPPSGAARPWPGHSGTRSES